MTASRIVFSIEYDGQVPMLRAELEDVNQDIVFSKLNLAERIENVNGRLEFSGCSPGCLPRGGAVG